MLLVGFVLIFDAFTLFDLLGDISRNHISVLTVLNYFRYLVPLMVYQLAPLATLVATLVTLAILAKNNEVIALKASGISLYRLVLPLLLCSCLVAGGMFLLDDTFLPYANQRQDALRNQIKGRPAQTYFEPARQWIFGEHSKIYNYELFDPDRQLFGGLNVFELDPATFQIRRRIFATRATWEPSENAWVLTGGWVRDFDADGHVAALRPLHRDVAARTDRTARLLPARSAPVLPDELAAARPVHREPAPGRIRYRAALGAVAEEIRVPADRGDYCVSRARRLRSLRGRAGRLAGWRSRSESAWCIGRPRRCLRRWDRSGNCHRYSPGGRPTRFSVSSACISF